MKLTKIIFPFFLVIICLCACDSQATKREMKHPIFRKASLLVEKGNYKEAVVYYKKYLQNHPKSAYAHLALATIYDENLSEPISAIYHYREFLALSDNAQEKQEVKLFLELCEKCLGVATQPLPLAELPQKTKKTPVVQTEQEEIPKKIEEKNITQEETVPQVANSKPYPVQKNMETPPAPPKAKVTETKQVEEKKDFPPLVIEKEKDEFPKEYVIKRGDTLGGISKKFYGSFKHYKKIMQANNIVNANDLKVGQKIIIPKID